MEVVIDGSVLKKTTRGDVQILTITEESTNVNE